MAFTRHKRACQPYKHLWEQSQALLTQRTVEAMTLEARVAELEHIANEWADAATNGLQWLRNVRDGIATPEQAIGMLECDLKHCREASTRPPNPARMSIWRNLP